MLWNEKFCFLHYPKTAGKSLTKFFLAALPRPIKGRVSKGQLAEVSDLDLEGVELMVGRGHENMLETKRFLEADGVDFDGLTAIFVCVRNPYDLMVSNYFYMRQNFHGANVKRPNFIIANENNFEDYVEKVGIASPRNWMTVEGKRPEQLRVIKFENMASELEKVSQDFNFPYVRLPHLNSAERGHYSEYMSPRIEECIYEKLKYVFDEGYYKRESFG
jgi:hypothetical protein